MIKFGEYEIIEQLGHGTSGFVYKAQKDSKLYAVKACTGFSEESLKRFDREIRIAKAINHPNIITVYDFDMAASNPYFVMELCDDTIDSIVVRLSQDEQINLALQICEGIMALHNAKIIHRDIKPQNILLQRGCVKVTDFSFGAFTDHNSTILTSTNQIIGTQGYIAPEVFVGGGHQATTLSDIYSLGCTLYYVFSKGQDPMYYDNQKVDPSLVWILEKCRATDPKERIRNVQDIIDELKAIQAPMKYISIEELINNKPNISAAEFRKLSYNFIMAEKTWDALIHDIVIIGKTIRQDILKNIPGSGESVLLQLENIFTTDTYTFKQYEDIDPFTDFCAEVFMSTSNILVKQKAIDLSLEFAVPNNRWNAIRVIKNMMLGKLKDNELRALSGFLKSKKELLGKMEENIGESLPSKVRLLVGL